jgi:hypothetical protein
MRQAKQKYIDNMIGAVVVGIAAMMFAGPFGLILFAPAMAGL